jgi:hypothetical protein
MSGTAEAVRLLRAIKGAGPGSHESNTWGWLTVDKKKNGEWTVMWTNGEDAHYRMFETSPALMASFDSEGLYCCFRSIIDMHLVYYRGHFSALGSDKSKLEAELIVGEILQRLTAPPPRSLFGRLREFCTW